VRLPRRPAAFLAVSALALSGLTACTSDSGSASGDKTRVVIGADMDTGSEIDQAYTRALQLRVEQVNNSGDLGDYELELALTDSRSDSTAALRTIGTLGDNSEAVALISGSCDVCVADNQKTITEKRLPTIALSASDAANIPGRDSYLFKLGPNSSDSTAMLVQQLTADKIKTIGVLYSTDRAGTDAWAHLKTAISSAGITVSQKSAVKPGANDISEPIGKIVQSEPQAIVVLTGAEQSTLATTAAKALQFGGKIYFDAMAGGDLYLPQNAARQTESTVMVFTQVLAIQDVVATTPAEAARKRWSSDYTARYGSYSGASAFAADAVDLIADAVAKNGNNRERIREVLETSQTDGLAGPLRFTPENHSGLMPQGLTLLVARSGQWRVLSS
jgi:branched-chain amino acid transport system substrate-binding protein